MAACGGGRRAAGRRVPPRTGERRARRALTGAAGMQRAPKRDRSYPHTHGSHKQPLRGAGPPQAAGRRSGPTRRGRPAAAATCPCSRDAGPARRAAVVTGLPPLEGRRTADPVRGPAVRRGASAPPGRASAQMSGARALSRDARPLSRGGTPRSRRARPRSRDKRPRSRRARALSRGKHAQVCRAKPPSRGARPRSRRARGLSRRSFLRSRRAKPPSRRREPPRTLERPARTPAAHLLRPPRPGPRTIGRAPTPRLEPGPKVFDRTRSSPGRATVPPLRRALV